VSGSEPLDLFPVSRFPMQDGPTVDMQTATEIYRVYVCLYGNRQTLEGLGQRGGFGWSEVELMWRKHAQQKARRMCRCANEKGKIE
jgi:hypothetical protein